MNTGKYITNVSGLQYFQLFRFGTILIISILFAKSHLLTEEIGRYEVLLLIAGAVCYFWVSGLIQSLLSLYNNNRSFSGNPVKSDDRSPVLFNAFLLMIFFTGLATLFVFVFSSFLATTLGGRSEIPCFDLLILYLLFSTPSNLIEYIYLLRNRPRHIIVYGTVTFLLQIVLVGGPVVAGYGIEYGIAGLVVISGLRFVWLSVLIFRHARFQFSRLFIREHISLAAPLIISIFLSGSAQFVDGFLVAYKFGEARLAVFRYGAREMPVVVLMANAFSTAMLPEFSPAGGIREAIATLRRKSLRLMHLLFPLTIILLLLSHRLYPIVFNNNFIDSARVFNLYLLIIVSRLVFPQTILIGMKKTGLIMIASFAELAVNVFLSIWFINIWGIAGVALATVIAYYLEKAVLILFSHTTLGVRPTSYIPAGMLTLYSLATIGVYCLVEFVLYAN